MEKDDGMDRLLSRRRFEPPSPDFAQHIMAAAAMLPQRAVPTLMGYLRQLCAEFKLPSPAYAVASVLMLGLALGVVGEVRDSHAGTSVFDEEGDL